MATTSSPPLLPLPSSTCTCSALRPVRPSRLRFKSLPPPTAAVSILPLGRGCLSWPSFRCGSTARPLPPSSEPPPPSPQDWKKLSRLQDTARIFFAVLFWMSLFFWGSAWGGTNNPGGKKRQRFRNKSK